MTTKEKVISLINYANETTGESDADLTSCVKSLVDGYGGGGEEGYTELNGIISVCHRGYAQYSNVCENTMFAFERAVENGYKYIETDIRHTSDSVPVLSHDGEIYVNETSNKITISNTSYSELNQYTIKGYTSEIASLQDFILFCKENKIIPFLEIKDGNEEQVEADYELVKSLGYEKSVVWISFNLQHLQYIKAKDSHARLSYVVDVINSTVITDVVSLKTNDNIVCIDADYTRITESLIQQVLASGIKVGVWTINNANELIRCQDFGVTMFTSDILSANKMIDSKITIESSDFMQGGIGIGDDNLLNPSRMDRITYTGYKFIAKVGRKYLLKIYTNSQTSGTLQVGIQTFNSSAFGNAKTGSWSAITADDRYDSLWQNDLAELVYRNNFTINNKPPAWNVITLHYTNNADISPSHIDKIEFYEIGFEDSQNMQ